MPFPAAYAYIPDAGDLYVWQLPRYNCSSVHIRSQSSDMDSDAAWIRSVPLLQTPESHCPEFCRHNNNLQTFLYPHKTPAHKVLWTPSSFPKADKRGPAVPLILRTSAAPFTSLSYHHPVIIDTGFDREYRADCLGSNPFSASGKSQPFLCCCFYIYLIFLKPQRLCYIFYHLWNMQRHLRPLGDNRRVNIDDLIMFLLQKLSHMFQQTKAGDSFICRIRIRKMPSDISQRRRA